MRAVRPTRLLAGSAGACPGRTGADGDDGTYATLNNAALVISGDRAAVRPADILAQGAQVSWPHHNRLAL
jgi:hypothetical protein